MPRECEREVRLSATGLANRQNLRSSTIPPSLEIAPRPCHPGRSEAKRAQWRDLLLGSAQLQALTRIHLACTDIHWYHGTHGRRSQTAGRARANRRSHRKTHPQSSQSLRRVPRHDARRRPRRHRAPRLRWKNPVQPGFARTHSRAEKVLHPRSRLHGQPSPAGNQSPIPAQARSARKSTKNSTQEETMSFVKSKIALTVLQWALGIVILSEAVLFVMPSAAHGFAATHMPGFIRLLLGWGEILGCILLLIPRTTIRGAWLLVAVFIFALLIHLLHGAYNVGNLVIYTAAAFAIAWGK